MITVENKVIPFYYGMTVADAIRDAGEIVDNMTIIMENKNIIQFSQIDKKISDGTNLKILRILSGG
ncbi:hypothetical protein [Sedimentibacter sp.]|uniref:hypothetical protein n=1 Tax=Sedimentibacter sp. TaxID=1960295 RepID=UPI0028A13CE7|nr:hypothetical protein [Sedimentibacter sp.]